MALVHPNVQVLYLDPPLNKSTDILKKDKIYDELFGLKTEYVSMKQRIEYYVDQGGMGNRMECVKAINILAERMLKIRNILEGKEDGPQD